MSDAYDEVTRPSHYCRGGMECKDVVSAMMADTDLPPMVAYWWGCAAKYLWRWPYKGLTPSERARDLRKARECLTECERAYMAHVAAQRAKVAAMVGEADG
ncbi:DUF3310 domain-containing protein [Atopobiaceae bacterium 24-176]